MRHVLVIRFGALGDLCLLARTLSRAADRPGARRVVLVTKPAFAPLLAEARGVDEVVPLPGPGPGGLLALAGALRRRRWDTVVDAHGVLRARALLGLLGRRADARLAKDTVARLRLLAGRRPDPRLARTMRDRFDALLPAVAGGPVDGPGDGPVFPALAEPAAAPAVLGLAPGARWDTKRWPVDRWAALVAAHAADAGRVRVFLGPRELAWYPGSPLESAVKAAGGDVVRDAPLPAVARALAGCAVLATNDSGLLHLAEAVGTPVVALFGPTVRAFGYFPALPGSVVLETDLECRPCSRNGKRPCHRGDLACLARIEVAAVRSALAPLLVRAAAGETAP